MSGFEDISLPLLSLSSSCVCVYVCDNFLHCLNNVKNSYYFQGAYLKNDYNFCP